MYIWPNAPIWDFELGMSKLKKQRWWCSFCRQQQFPFSREKCSLAVQTAESSVWGSKDPTPPPDSQCCWALASLSSSPFAESYSLAFPTILGATQCIFDNVYSAWVSLCDLQLGPLASSSSGTWRFQKEGLGIHQRKDGGGGHRGEWV